MLALRFTRLLSGTLATLLLSTSGGVYGIDARVPQDATSLHFYNPTPSFSFTPTSTASNPTSTPSVYFAFADIQNTTVCGSDSISWFYAGAASYTVGLAIVSVGQASSGEPTPDILEVMTGNLKSENTYTWSPVSVPAGAYAVAVSIPDADFVLQSSTFYVFDSSDHTCLNSTTSSVSSDPASSTGAPSTSPSSGSSTDLPVVGATSGSPSMSGGAIAGVVIGVLAFMGGLIAIWLLLRRYCKRSANGGISRGGFFEKRPPKGAVAIGSRGGSFSSSHRAAIGAAGAGFGMGSNYNSRFPSQSAVSHGNSEEDVASIALAGEKPVTHASPVALDAGVAMPVAIHRTPHVYRDSVDSAVTGSTIIGSPGGMANYLRPSRHSSLLYSSDPFSSSPSTPSPRPSGDYSTSGSQSQVPIGLFSPPSNMSTPRTFGSPGVPRDISVASSSLPDLAYESESAVPSAAAVAPTGSRRAPPAPPVAVPAPATAYPSRRTKSASARKPAPVYAPSVSGEALELVEPATPRSATLDASYYRNNTNQQSHASLAPSSSAGGDWSSAAAHSHSPASGVSPASSGSHLPPTSTSPTSPTSPSTLVGHQSFIKYGSLPELNHKSSFGDRQMHFLIPDPPPGEMR
ncbi:hypothetical protein DFH11DRAFT_1725578 [Phellopilus nigrolimitatus]|nr:hypothetical protein DFH11DRAFT_1725578 [Phellopilus nigrolimitatus]